MRRGGVRRRTRRDVRRAARTGAASVTQSGGAQESPGAWMRAWVRLARTGALAVVLGGAAPGWADDGTEGASRRRFVSTRVEGAPVIDGLVERSFWAHVATSTAFVERLPRPDAAPRAATQLWIAHDRHTLYVAVRAEQRGTPITRRLARRDRVIDTDRLIVELDATGLGRAGFHFELSAAGVQSDAIRLDPSTDDDDDGDEPLVFEWDELWRSGTVTSTGGWSAELAIPFRALRFDPTAARQVRFQVRRVVAARAELVEWQPIPRALQNELSGYADLVLEGEIEADASYQLRPFLLASLTHDEPSGAYVESGWAPRLSVGADLKLHLGVALVLDLALRPDFGQVEADRALLNLGTVEIVLPERRPFFLEGLALFETPMQLLYTRRIGRVVDEPELEGDERFVARPTAQPIDAAAKLSGRMGADLGVAALVALTAPQTVEVARPGGVGGSTSGLGTNVGWSGPGSARAAERGRGARSPGPSFGAAEVGRAELTVQAVGEEVVRFTAQPRALYAAGRAQLELVPRLSVGALATSVLRLEAAGTTWPAPWAEVGPGAPPARGTRCASGARVAPAERCTHDAHVVATDAVWRSEGGDWVARAQLALGVRGAGRAGSTPDGTILTPGLVSPAASVELTKDGGTWIGGLRYGGYAPGFDPNDMGFLPRANLHLVEVRGGWRDTEADGKWIERRLEVRARLARTSSGLVLGNDALVSLVFEHASRAYVYGEVSASGARLDDRELADGRALERAERLGGGVALGSPRTQAVRAEGWFGGAVTPSAQLLELDANLAASPLDALELGLNPALIYARGEPRYLADLDDRAVFGALEAWALSATLRATWSFGPKLTLQAYAQLFLDAERSDALRDAPRSARVYRLDALVPRNGDGFPFALGRSGATLNATVVLRWEYDPGAALFVVYARNQTGESARSAPDAWVDLGQLLRVPASDTLLVKWTAFLDG